MSQEAISLMDAADTFTKGVIAIDNGGRFTKVVTKHGIEVFPSDKGPAWNRSVGQEYREKYDFDVTWNGSDISNFVAGTLARREGVSMEGFTETKSSDYFILSILIAIHQYGYDKNYVLTTVPINKHIKNEKDAIANKLIGQHTLIVNGKSKEFEIVKASIIAEGLNAFWVDRPMKKMRWLDIGSRTINAATTEIIDGKVYPVDRQSDTFDLGLEKIRSHNYAGFAETLRGNLGRLDWKEHDEINIIGGGALNSELVVAMQKIYPKATVPQKNDDENFAQTIVAQGMYVLGKGMYKVE